MAKPSPSESIDEVLVGAPPARPLPSFEIAERRAQNGDLDALREVDASAELVNQPWPMMTRWVFTGPGAPLDSFYDIIAKRGYVQVHKDELRTTPERNGWGQSPEGYVTRGERGHEVLVKMPRHLYQQIQIRKAQDGDAKRRSVGTLRQQVSDTLAAEGHGRAAEVAGHMQMTEFQESADVRKV
jgi:hypothetical protein